MTVSGISLDIVYDDLSDVWPFVASALEQRLPLQQLQVTNKLGAPVIIQEVPVRLLPTTSPSLQRLAPHARSAAAWFRQPTATLVCISCEDAEDFRRNFRLQLRAMVDPDTTNPLAAEPVFVYVRPLATNPDSKGAARVIDAMRRELGIRGRERVVRIDASAIPKRDASFEVSGRSGWAVASTRKKAGNGSGSAVVSGLDELIGCLKEAVAASLEARTAAYEEEARKHLAMLHGAASLHAAASSSGAGVGSSSMTPTAPTAAAAVGAAGVVPAPQPLQPSRASCADFFLVKDSLAAMLEAAGLLEDALREYLELEAALQQHFASLDAVKTIGKTPRGVAAGMATTAGLGALTCGTDEAAGVWADWAAARQVAASIQTVESGGGIPSLLLRQSVFANQTRVLLKLQQHADVLQKGLALLHHGASILVDSAPLLAAESWAFAVAVSLAGVVSMLRAAEPTTGVGGASSPSPSAAAAASAMAPSSLRHAGMDAVDAAVQKILTPPASDPSSRSLSFTIKNGTEDALSADQHGKFLAVDTISDWKLGCDLPSQAGSRVAGYPAPSATAARSAPNEFGRKDAGDGKLVCCLLGKLYLAARHQLEALGRSSGMLPPKFAPRLTDVAASIDLATSSRSSVPQPPLPAPTTHTISTPAGASAEGGATASCSSPRRYRGRSLSPTRASIERGSARGLAASPHTVDSGDDAMSTFSRELSLRVSSSGPHQQHQHEQNGAVTSGGGANFVDSMHTVDLSAPLTATEAPTDAPHAPAQHHDRVSLNSSSSNRVVSPGVVQHALRASHASTPSSPFVGTTIDAMNTSNLSAEQSGSVVHPGSKAALAAEQDEQCDQAERERQQSIELRPLQSSLDVASLPTTPVPPGGPALESAPSPVGLGVGIVDDSPSRSLPQHPGHFRAPSISGPLQAAETKPASHGHDSETEAQRRGIAVVSRASNVSMKSQAYSETESTPSTPGGSSTSAPAPAAAPATIAEGTASSSKRDGLPQEAVGGKEFDVDQRNVELKAPQGQQRRVGDQEVETQAETTSTVVPTRGLADVENLIAGHEYASKSHRRSTSYHPHGAGGGAHDLHAHGGTSRAQKRPASARAANDAWTPQHWRLKIALSSPEAFADLWKALGAAAAACFEGAGRWRQALMLRSDVATCCAAQGDYAEAARLYEAQCRLALYEGWTGLAMVLLPKLAACQSHVGAEGLPNTAAALLSVLSANSESSVSSYHYHQASGGGINGSTKPKGGPVGATKHSGDVIAALKILQSAAASAAASDPTGIVSLPPSLVPLSRAGLLDASVDMSSVLHASPLRFSKFYGLVGPDGVPSLTPHRGHALHVSQAHKAENQTSVLPLDREGGHLTGAIGDVLELTVEVVNTLPETLVLRDASLVLVGMQDAPVFASLNVTSPRALHNQAPAVPSNAQHQGMQHLALSTRSSLATSYGATTPHHQGTTSPGSMSFARTFHSFGGPGSSLSPTAGVVNGAPAAHSTQGNHLARQHSFIEEDVEEAPKVTVQWQDIEELHCPLVAVAGNVPGTNVAASRKKATPPVDTPLGDHKPLLRPFSGPVQLHPGSNFLRFMAAPVKRALYRPIRIVASLENLPIQLAVDFPRTPTQQSSSSGDADIVVLAVDTPVPRVTMTPATAGGTCLYAGHEQWLGLSLFLNTDALVDARLSITWPLPPTTVADIARKVSGLTGLALPATPTAEAPASTSLSGELSLAAAAAAGGALPTLTIEKSSQAAVVIVNASRRRRAAATIKSDGNKAAEAAETAEVMDENEVVVEDVIVSEDGTQEVCLPAPTAAVGNGDNKKHAESELDRSGTSVWWWTEASNFVLPPEPVRVGAPGSFAPAPAGWLLQEGHAPGSGVADPGSFSPAVVDIPVTLEYLSGCRRSHTQVLPVAIQQPFAVRTSAQELPGGVIVLHCMLVSAMPHAVEVSQVQLQPQPGLVVAENAIERLNLLPLIVGPGTQLSLSFLLHIKDGQAMMIAGDRAMMQARVHAAVKLHPTALTVSYHVSQSDVCGAAVPESLLSSNQTAPSNSATAHHHHYNHYNQQQSPQRSAVHDNANSTMVATNVAPATPLVSATLAALHRHVAGGGDPRRSASDHAPLRLPSLDSLRKVCSTARARREEARARQSCSFTHRCCLELSNLDAEDPGATVLVQLLGPVQAVVGSPITLCWRLERTGSVPSGELVEAAPARVAFEVLAEGDAWRPLGRRLGTVVLDSYDGALATVEATWVPLAVGALPVPTLRLADVAYQEVFEVGSGGANYVMVTVAGPQ